MNTLFTFQLMTLVVAPVTKVTSQMLTIIVYSTQPVTQR